MTSVPSLRTTVTDLGPWLPVRRCSKAIAAWAICCAMVDLRLFITFSPAVATACLAEGEKKSRHDRIPKGIQSCRLTRQRAPRHGRVALHLVIRRLQIYFTARR